MLATLLKKGGNMSVLRPISEIRLYKCPALSPTYRDSYYFKGADADARKRAQEAFFNGLNAKTLSESQVTRISNNQVKVPYPVAELREYNYMAIVNQTYDETTGDDPSDRIYYCFIMNVEYVSNMCTLITFKVDVIQTYICDAYIRESFVERCHADSDNMFEHRELEPFTVSNYTCDDTLYREVDFYCVIGLVQGTHIDWDGDGTNEYDVPASVYRFGLDNTNTEQIVPVAGAYYIFRLNSSLYPSDYVAWTRLMTSIQSQTDSVFDYFMIPKEAFIRPFSSVVNHMIPEVLFGTAYEDWDIKNIIPTASSALSGYTPVNKKLYNYPFTMIRVISSSGNHIDLKSEEFNALIDDDPQTTDVECRLEGGWFGGGALTLYPKNYENNANDANRNYALPLTGFPVCPYKTNYYKAFMENKFGAEATQSAISSVASLIGVGLASAVAPPLVPIMGIHAAGTVLNSFGTGIGDKIEASKKPNQMLNNNNSPNTSLHNNKFGYIAQRLSLSKPEAEVMDNYFTMFGYSLNKTINVRDYMENSKRSKFFYIKTMGFNVQGNMPCAYKTEFDDIFNNGITFWKTTATVGEYSQNDITP